MVAYQDGTLSIGRQEIVEAHLAACDHCQERLATFRDADRIIQEHAVAPELPAQMRAALRTRLHNEADRRAGLLKLQKFISMPRPFATKLLVALLVLLAALPAVTQAGFPMGRFVRFAEVEIKDMLPLDAQGPIQHVARSDPNISDVSFATVAPAELPLGLVRVEQSVPHPERLELLYRNRADIAILVTELPAADGMVTLEATGTDLEIIRGTEVLIVTDPRPGAVAALIWERDGIFFDIKVIEAPTGKYGGFKRSDALQVVEALIAAQDAAQQ